MKLGLILPTIGAGAGPEGLDAAAGAVVAAGWNSVWVTDHLLVPAGPEAEEYGWVLEATSSLTWVAARFPSLAVGFSVIIPAMRDAPLLAKQLATIDCLTGGRLTVGVGASDRYDLPEYRNLGKDDRFKRRGAYLDESIALWRHLWSGATEPFEGEFHTLRDYNFAPLPSRGAALPIWCGGRSDRAIHRAATLAEGYHSAQTGPADVAMRMPKLQAEAAAAGRPVPIVSVRVRARPGMEPIGVYSLHGCARAMIDEVVEFAKVGVEELVVLFRETAPGPLAGAIRSFDSEVVQPALARIAQGDAG
ncbi:MAG TPA: LLM class flavin-dependent oxidoreductase [Gaiellaceae bacterium]|jgi:alkanesulfonate monooxygenase SsuD/methylene tetrahydromethanopterin reductase-like flavin-dependent oxidoreductase (luciferase family)